MSRRVVSSASGKGRGQSDRGEAASRVQKPSRAAGVGGGTGSFPRQRRVARAMRGAAQRAADQQATQPRQGGRRVASSSAGAAQAAGDAGARGRGGTKGRDKAPLARPTRRAPIRKVAPRDEGAGRVSPSRDVERRKSPSAPVRAAAGSSGKERAVGFVDARRLHAQPPVQRRLDQAFGQGRDSKVVDARERIRERRQAGRRVVAVRVAVSVAVVAVVSLLVWALCFSPMLRLHADEVSVNGANEWVPADGVAAVAEERAGTSLLLVSSKAIRERVQAMAGVTSVSVTKRFPHGIEIDIEAQRPAALLKDSSGGLTAVDSEAKVLNPATSNTEGIPVIQVSDTDSGLRDRAVIQAVSVLSQMPEAMRTNVSEVSAKTQDSVTTKLKDGHTIVWGDSTDMKLKAAIVAKVLADPNVIGDYKQVDVSAPSRPILK